MTDTTTNPSRWRLALLALFAAFALLASACGDDGDDDEASTPTAESTAEDDMAEDDMAEDGLEDLRSELAAAGLDDGQITCVLDAAVAEWGADALTAPGQASDDQLLRLGAITFGCL